MDDRCKSCNSVMKEIDKKQIKGTTYIIFRCEKCKKEVARNAEG